MRRKAKNRDALRAAALLMGSFITILGCSAAQEDDVQAAPSADGDGNSGLYDEDEQTSGDPSSAGDDDFGSTSGLSDGNDEPGDASQGDDGSTGGDTHPTPPIDEGPYALCPKELPEGWIFCEDFEELGDPADVFFDFQDGDGAFGPSYDGGASGLGAMRATYREGVEAAGFFSISFGANPINEAGRTGYAEDESFEEIYWRFRVRTQVGWPNAGPHALSRVSAFAQEDWGQAMVAALTSDGDAVNLLGRGQSCVDAGNVECTGVDDETELQPLGSLQGFTPVFSGERGGQWQCVEAHVRLNTPGAADGVFEFWVDDTLEATSSSLDWRGDWSAFGLNLLSIENFWLGGAPADLDRWIDDVVISTEPIGCD